MPTWLQQLSYCWDLIVYLISLQATVIPQPSLHYVYLIFDHSYMVQDSKGSFECGFLSIYVTDFTS